MRFLVMSNPQPAKPGEVKTMRVQFRAWLRELEKTTIVFSAPKVGRGFVVVFEVESNEELHQLLTQWSNIVPAEFNIYPLVSASIAEELLK